MSNVLRFRLAAVLLILVSMQLPVFAQGLFHNLNLRRGERQPVITTPAPEDTTFFRRAVRQPAVTMPSPADAVVQLQRLASEMKANPRTLTEGDLNRSQRLLLDTVIDLQRRLPREFDRETADDWSTTFQLVELRATLGQRTPDPEILEAVQGAFLSDKEGILWVQFDGLRTALRRYLNVAQMFEENTYAARLTSVCDGLVEWINTYSEGRNPLYFITLTNAVTWLDDISLFDPRAARLAALTRAAISGVNVRLQVGNDFVAAGFVEAIEEALDIDEVILGTRVVGGGTLSGMSSSELVRSPNKAAIRVIADAFLETHTDGTRPRMTLKNHTTGTMLGEKQILFSADGITTTPARARANLDAQLSDIQINAGPLVRLIARSQIEPRSEDSLAEASRRAERRMSDQMNDRIDANIAELNERYQRIKGVMNRVGLFPRVWNLATTTDQIDWSILLGNRYQPSAPIPAPAVESTNGLAVQVHQSSLNNMLTILLAGRLIEEERFAERISEFLDETPEFLQRRADETPATVSFDGRIPVDVLFVDNRIRVVVRLNDIQVMDNAGRSFTITVEYQIKMEDGVVVLEQTEAEAFPAGFRPGVDTLSATQTIIRSYLMRRLEALPQRQEAEALELGGQWKGKGQLIPQFASTEQGWLTLVWSWQSAE